MNKKNKKGSYDDELLLQGLHYLKLSSIGTVYENLAILAAKESWTFPQYLTELINEEVTARKERSMGRRVKAAHFPVIKTRDNFEWHWPKKINRMQIEHFFRLSFLKNASNIIFIGGTGLGKTHLSIALGYQACLKGKQVLFTSAIDMINSLNTAQKAGRFVPEIKKFRKPHLLIIDEVGYLPIDKKGADLLFQVISKRYEQNSTLITTNKPFKKWAEIFSNDSTLTSAFLDRLLHHAEVSIIEGASYRMKKRVKE